MYFLTSKLADGAITDLLSYLQLPYMYTRHQITCSRLHMARDVATGAASHITTLTQASRLYTSPNFKLSSTIPRGLWSQYISTITLDYTSHIAKHHAIS